MYVHLPHYPPAAFAGELKNGDFAACMAALDWSVSVLRNELEQLGLLENTLIVFTSDNGSRGDYGASNGALRGIKGTTWEGGQRVPCIWFWPEKLREGRLCDEVCSHIDLLPSFLKLAGLDGSLPNKIDGQDITEVVIENKERSEEENVFFYYWMEALEAVRVGKWKLFVSRQNEEVRELYDLENDVVERVNLYQEQPEIVNRLYQYIADMRPVLGDSATAVFGADCRPAGRVENPRPLTQYEENHPYIIAMYDSPHSG